MKTGHDATLKNINHDAAQSGLAAWIPTDDTSATPFFGVDRTEHAACFARIRLDGTAKKALLTLVGKISRFFREKCIRNRKVSHENKEYEIID